MIGEAFGNFRIVSRLGRGGMGEVWLAEQQSIGTRVAVKLLLPEISADAEHVQRFFNEARAVSRIQHAGIVKIFDVGFHASGHAYLVMEFLEGESLAGRIRRTIQMSPAHIADLGRQIFEADAGQIGGGTAEAPAVPHKPDRGQLTRLLAAQNTAIARCGAHDRVTGTVEVRVTIAPDGRASAIANATGGVKGCVESTLNRVRFPPSVKGDVIEKRYALAPPRTR